MKKLRAISFVIGLLLILALLPRPAKLEASFAKDAELEMKTGRMIHGAGTVLQILKYQPTALLSLGVPHFQNLSIWIPELKLATYEFADPTRALGFYAEGEATSSATGCRGEIHSGQLEVLSIEAQFIKVRIRSHFDCVDGSAKSEIKLDQGYALESKDSF